MMDELFMIMEVPDHNKDIEYAIDKINDYFPWVDKDIMLRNFYNDEYEMDKETGLYVIPCCFHYDPHNISFNNLCDFIKQISGYSLSEPNEVYIDFTIAGNTEHMLYHGIAHNGELEIKEKSGLYLINADGLDKETYQFIIADSLYHNVPIVESIKTFLSYAVQDDMIDMGFDKSLIPTKEDISDAMVEDFINEPPFSNKDIEIVQRTGKAVISPEEYKGYLHKEISIDGLDNLLIKDAVREKDLEDER